VLQGIDRVIPVDVYIPGCPPRPEQVIDGILKIQELPRTKVCAAATARNTRTC
jgi:NADH-quinone oxidoreductase subunit B